MKIAILGTGRVGGTLGTRWLQAGHQVAWGSRNPDSERARALAANGDSMSASWQQAADTADVLVLALPWPMTCEAVKSLHDLAGKTLVDCTNPLNGDFSGLDLGFTTSAAEQIAKAAPGSHVVKAFNTVSSATMADPTYAEQRATMFFCGDDAAAKSTVKQLAEDIGLEAVDAGPLMNARHLEPMAMLYIHLAVREGWGSDCAFKIMKR